MKIRDIAALATLGLAALKLWMHIEISWVSVFLPLILYYGSFVLFIFAMGLMRFWIERQVARIKATEEYRKKKMKTDAWGEVINDPQTYREIAQDLKNDDAVIIGWTDGRGTHFDILFNWIANQYGNLQGGVKGRDLFVSIMRMGAFGFEVKEDETHSGYFEEKLGSRTNLGATTAEALAELINGVRKELSNG